MAGLGTQRPSTAAAAASATTGLLLRALHALGRLRCLELGLRGSVRRYPPSCNTRGDDAREGRECVTLARGRQIGGCMHMACLLVVIACGGKFKGCPYSSTAHAAHCTGNASGLGAPQAAVLPTAMAHHLTLRRAISCWCFFSTSLFASSSFTDVCTTTCFARSAN